MADLQRYSIENKCDDCSMVKDDDGDFVFFEDAVQGNEVHHTEEMREILKGIVGAWDKSDVEPRLLTVSFHKESIQRMRRMVEYQE